MYPTKKNFTPLFDLSKLKLVRVSNFSKEPKPKATTTNALHPKENAVVLQLSCLRTGASRSLRIGIATNTIVCKHARRTRQPHIRRLCR